MPISPELTGTPSTVNDAKPSARFSGRLSWMPVSRNPHNPLKFDAIGPPSAVWKKKSIHCPPPEAGMMVSFSVSRPPLMDFVDSSRVTVSGPKSVGKLTPSTMVYVLPITKSARDEGCMPLTSGAAASRAARTLFNPIRISLHQGSRRIGQTWVDDRPAANGLRLARMSSPSVRCRDPHARHDPAPFPHEGESNRRVSE